MIWVEDTLRHGSLGGSGPRKWFCFFLSLTAGFALLGGGLCALTVHASEPPSSGLITLSDEEIIKSAWDALLAESDAATGVSLQQALTNNDWAAQESILDKLIEEGFLESSCLHALRGLVRQRQYRILEALDDYVAAQTRGRMQRDFKGVVQRVKREIDQIVAAAERTGQAPAYIALLRDIRFAIHSLNVQSDKGRLDQYLGSLFVHESILPYVAVKRAYLRLSGGEFDKADDDFKLAERSHPGDVTKKDIERGGELLGKLRREPEAAKALIPDSALLEKLPETPWELTASRFAYADELLEMKKYDWLEMVLEQLRSRDLSAREEGNLLNYTGELQWGRGEYDAAYQTFTVALGQVRGNNLRSNILFRMAEHHAKKGDIQKAVELAEQSAELMPGQDWLQRRVGSFLVDLGEQEKGFAYLEKTRERAGTHEDKARSYSALAEIHLKRGDLEKYLEYAGKFIDEMKEALPPRTPSLEALAVFYQGEIHQARGDVDEAYNYYELASRQVTDRHRLSDIFMKLSDYFAKRGDRERAVAYARQSADAVPNQPWKLRQVGIALLRQGELEEGASFIARSHEMDDNPRNRAVALLALADGYKRGGYQEDYHRYAREYIDILDKQMEAPTPNEKGLGDYFRGEIFLAEGVIDEAYSAYERAIALLTDKYYLSDAYVRMAEFEARKRNREKASEYAERAAALLPEQYWRQLQIGELFTRLGMPDKALEYLTLHSQVTAARRYAAMAEAYKQNGDQEQYLAYAQKYIDELALKEHPTPEEEGLRAFYEAEILDGRGEREKAYQAYERATGLLRDKFRLSDIYVKMAAYQMSRGDRDAAAALSEKSAEVLADQGWKLQQVGNVFVQMNRPLQAINYFERALETAETPDREASVISSLADAYAMMGVSGQDKYLEYARRYGEVVAGNNRVPTEAEEGLWAFYQGETHLLRNEPEEAYRAYERASRLLVDKSRLADTHLKIAEILFRRGDRQDAVREADKVVQLYPDQAWRQQQVGDFLVRMDLPEKAAEYYRRFRELNPAPERDAAVYTALADAYKKQGDQDRYLEFARNYRKAMQNFVRQPSEAEDGLDSYYQGELLANQGELDDAFTAYERATLLVQDKYRLAEIYAKMADYQVKRNNRNQAANYMERSVALLPDVGWKLREAGNLYTRIDRLEEALAHFERALELSSTPVERASTYVGMAEAYRKLRDQNAYLHYAREYLGSKREYADEAANAEDDTYVYYQAELYAAEGEEHVAYEEYERASRLARDPSRLSDIYVKMALYNARQGDRTRASELMERSISLFPDQLWKLRQAGDFYYDLDLTDRAIKYYELALALAPSPTERAPLYAGIAESYKKKRDTEQFLSFAAKHNDALAEREGELTPAERGLRAYYQGEIFTAAERVDEAYREYERASTLVAAPTQLSDIFLKMAQYHAKRGEKEQAVINIEKSVSFYPDKPWKLRQAGEVYFSLDMLDKAIEYFERALEHSTGSSSVDSVASYGELAEIYKRLRQQDNYLLYAERYVEAVSGRDGELTKAEEGLRAYYQGDILSARDEPHLANEAYTRASVFFLDNATRLSDCLMRMAEYQAKFGDRALAVEYGERSVALLPTRSWRLQEGGDLFRPMDGMLDRAIELYQGAVEYATSLTNKAAATSALADSYKRKADTENYHIQARRYLELLDERGGELTDGEKGLFHYYTAELYQTDEHYERAYDSYVEASKYVTEKLRLADIYMQMAEHQARHKNKELAIAYAKQSAELLTDYSWKLRQVGDFLARQDELEKAFQYFDRAMEKAKTIRDEAGVHMSRADAYRASANQVSRDERIYDPQTRARKRQEMNYKFCEHARIYIETIGQMKGDATDSEVGLKWFYCGLMSSLTGDDESAYKSYERANGLLKDRYRRSETLLYMARLNAKWDNGELAYWQACESAKLLPGAGWRISELSRIFVGLKCYPTAKAILARALELNPRDNIFLYKDMAYAYVESGDKETGLCYSAKYIDYMTEIIEELGPNDVSRRQLDDWWHARERHTSWSKSKWELDVYLFGSRKEDRSHTLSAMAELVYNFKLCNGMRGKFYGQLGGTLNGYYHGDYWSTTRNRWERWESRPKMDETLYALVGVRISPIKKWGPLSVGIEKVFGIGRETDDDTRLRVLWDQTHGAKPRPYGKYWAYQRNWVDNVYSIKEKNFTSEGTFRRGVTISNYVNSNFLTIPYLSFQYDYGGTKADHGDRFGLEGGPGVLFRHWFREDKYHTPRTYVELNLYYRFGITNNRDDTYGFSARISF